MAEQDIHITSDIPDFNMPQVGDGEIMLAFLKAGFHSEELAMLNRCRLFCQVIYMSDLCTGAGDQVDSQWLQGKIRETKQCSVLMATDRHSDSMQMECVAPSHPYSIKSG